MLVVTNFLNFQNSVYEGLAKADAQFKHNTSGVYETYRNTLKHSYIVEMLNQMYELYLFTSYVCQRRGSTFSREIRNIGTKQSNPRCGKASSGYLQPSHFC